jgi:hypothetical protein
MLQTCDVGFCVEEGEGKLLMLDVARNTSNIVATWSQHEGGGRRPTDV